jgi:hypothetical protein
MMRTFLLALVLMGFALPDHNAQAQPWPTPHGMVLDLFGQPPTNFLGCGYKYQVVTWCDNVEPIPCQWRIVEVTAYPPAPYNPYPIPQNPDGYSWTMPAYGGTTYVTFRISCIHGEETLTYQIFCW